MNYYLIALLGIFLGFSMAAPPGPINSIVIDRSAKSLKGGVKIGLGAMTADFIFMIIIFYFQRIVNLSQFLIEIYLSGAVLFIFLVFRMKKPQKSKDTIHFRMDEYLTGLGIGLLNPYQIVWWLSAGLAIFETFGVFPFYFFFLGIVSWILIITFLIHYSYMIYGEKLKSYLTDFSAIILLIFAILFIFEAILKFY
ncbi:MAG: LysE family transporter [Thermoplasmataceae archaeon]